MQSTWSLKMASLLAGMFSRYDPGFPQKAILTSKHPGTILPHHEATLATVHLN